MGKIGVECCSANLEGSNSTLGSHNNAHCNISSKRIIHNLIAKSWFFFCIWKLFRRKYTKRAL